MEQVAHRDAALLPQAGRAEELAASVWLVPVRHLGAEWWLVVIEDEPVTLKPTRDEALAASAAQVRRYVGRCDQARERAQRLSALWVKQAACAHDFDAWETVGRGHEQRWCRKCGVRQEAFSDD